MSAPLSGPPEGQEPFFSRLKHVLFGQKRDLQDRSLFKDLTLIPLLAWIGFGADGLSSSSYGPEESFRALGGHTYLAVGLAVVTALTVIIISAAYMKIIEAFPNGGGGYVVATRLLGPRTGLVAGGALLVDYVLTIAISIAAAGDALFSLVPLEYHPYKQPVETALLLGLMGLNLRGIRESVLALTPIFFTFLITHIGLILLGVWGHAADLPATATAVKSGFQQGLQFMGPWPLFLIFIHAYSLGGGTYTGIEAVSNGMSMMREPRVANAKRTMVYMAISLAFTAAGLVLCYLLWRVEPETGKTLNAVLLEQVAQAVGLHPGWVMISLLAEGLLLVVAAQAGFFGGPRVLVNMALDGWVPKRFSALSERLTTYNGIVMMGLAAWAILIYTEGSVAHLVVMYSINVFLTFSLSILGMLTLTLRTGRQQRGFKRNLALFSVGLLVCLTILVITTFEKFLVGGWLTILITTLIIVPCLFIRAHYQETARRLRHLYADLEIIPPVKAAAAPDLKSNGRTAAILVSSYGGMGIHILLTIFRLFPGVYHNFLFISVGALDSGGFKGEGAIDELKTSTAKMLDQYVQLAHSLGVPATSRMALATDVAEEGFLLCRRVAKEFPSTTFFAGKIIFQKERWYQRLLHNETAFSMQKRLQFDGHTMVILPVKVN